MCVLHGGRVVGRWIVRNGQFDRKAVHYQDHRNKFLQMKKLGTVVDIPHDRELAKELRSVKEVIAENLVQYLLTDFYSCMKY